MKKLLLLLFLFSCGGTDPRVCYDPYTDCILTALHVHELTQSTDNPDSPEDLRFFSDKCYSEYLECMEAEGLEP